MPQYKEFLLPDVGEGLTEADILSWSVAPGDTVVVNQTLVEVETAKAAVELPSPFAGVVRTLHAQPGDTVEVGRPIITIDVDPAGGAREPAGGSSAEAAETGAARAEPPDSSLSPDSSHSPDSSVTPAAEIAKREAVLVGYGVSTGRPSRRQRRSQPPTGPTPTAQPSFSRPATERAILVKPPVRKLAKHLGIDLSSVTPTGPNGSVSREDLQRASAPVTESGPSNGEPSHRNNRGREERIAVRGVRKHTATAMVASAFTAPHVSEFVAVDVTSMMELRDRVAARREFAGVRVPPLLFVARAVLWAAKRTPMINASWAGESDEIVVKNYVNLGIAAATDRGLIVPNIKDADQLTLLELAEALGALTEIARAGRTSPADMSGGTFTITNVGVFGIDTGTPILNPGEAAILAVGAIRRVPWVVASDGVETIAPRSVMQLSVSFDHRIIDGQQGSEFLADVAGLLSDPGLGLL